jgi:hypothetical protein
MLVLGLSSGQAGLPPQRSDSAFRIPVVFKCGSPNYLMAWRFLFAWLAIGPAGSRIIWGVLALSHQCDIDGGATDI